MKKHEKKVDRLITMGDEFLSIKQPDEPDYEHSPCRTHDTLFIE